MSVIGSNVLAGASGGAGAAAGYTIQRSLRFNSADSAYLSRTPSSLGDRKTYTFSGWFKLAKLSAQFIFSGGSPRWGLYYSGAGKLITDISGVGAYNQTVALLRDFSAWYHIVWTVDTTNSTANDRSIIYINGLRADDDNVRTLASNSDTPINTTSAHYLSRSSDLAWHLDSYVADVHFVDGQALTPTDFGEYDDNNVWQPKEFAGQYTLPEALGSSSPTVFVGVPISALDESDVRYLNSNPDSNAYPLIQESSTGSESERTIRVKFHTPVSSVTSIKFKGGGYAAGQAYTLYVNGSQVGGTHTTASGWSEVEHTISSTDVSEIKIIGGGSSYGFALGQLKLNNSLVSGTPSYGTLAQGTNSFHLDLSDNSSSAALGTDSSGNSNTWTVNNIQATDASVSASAQLSNLYGTSTAATPSGGLDIGYISATVGTDPGNIAFLKFNFSALGLTAPATITFSSYQQGGGGWSVVPNTVYTDAGNTTSTFTFSSNTRYNTVSIPAGATYFAIPPSYTSVAGGIVSNGIGSLVWDGTPVANSYAYNCDSLIDTPTNYDDGTNVGGNYCTWNPLSNHEHTASNGNLEVGTGASDGNSRINGTFAASSGKWYFEVQQKGSSPSYSTAGISKTDITEQFPGNDAGSWSYEVGQGKAKNNNTYSSSYSTFGDGDILMVAFDIDAGKLWFGKNGTFFNSGDPANGTNAIYTNLGSGSFRPCARPYGSGNSFVLNAGQRSFSYTLPAGYKSLCTTNLPDPTIADGSAYFDTVTYTGNSSTQTISGLEFSPDLLWYKTRNGAFHHGLQDSVRGVGKSLSSSTTSAESTETTGLTAFTSDGFTLDGTGFYYINSNNTMVAWAWDAGEATTTIAAGSLNSSAYDQSQTWSNFVSGTAYSGYPITNAFNGDLSNRSLESGSTGHTFTPPSAITVTSSLRIYIAYGDASATNVLKVNGTDYSSLITSTGNIGWITIPNISSVTSIFYGVSPGGIEDSSVSAIEVDGKILVDSGVTPPTNVPTIASTVRANPTAGFSIVSYTGTGSPLTVGHGLNSAPEFIIIKRRSGTENWLTYHRSIGATQALFLNLTNSTNTSTDWFNNTDPSSSVFTLGSGNPVNNNSGDTYIAYCFAPVEGYSAFGSYEGTGTSDNSAPFIFTGFRPKWLMIKNVDNFGTGYDWHIHDTERDPSNVSDSYLSANTSSSEQTYAVFDILSNGFKLKNSGGSYNLNAHTHVWAAFAEHPFKTARAR